MSQQLFSGIIIGVLLLYVINKTKIFIRDFMSGLVLGALILILLRKAKIIDFFENSDSEKKSKPRSKQCAQESINTSVLSHIFGSPQTTR